jgi:hypothetical protein
MLVVGAASQKNQTTAKLIYFDFHYMKIEA